MLLTDLVHEVLSKVVINKLLDLLVLSFLNLCLGIVLIHIHFIDDINDYCSHFSIIILDPSHFEPEN